MVFVEFEVFIKSQFFEQQCSILESELETIQR